MAPNPVSLLRAAVLGEPVAHSLSPRLHTRWLKEAGIHGEYKAISVRPDALAETFERLQEEGYRGWNLTVPHKESGLLLVDELDAAARTIGAVNTVVVAEEGRLIGKNTDAYGFSENLRACKVNTKKALVVGAGGAARAVIYALREMGFESVVVCNRTASRAEELARQFSVSWCEWQQATKEMRECSLLVNTTSLGMRGQPELTLDLSALPADVLVTDIVYRPLMTPLLTQAAARGNPVRTGIGMLIHQAVPGFTEWFGQAPKLSKGLEEWLVA